MIEHILVGTDGGEPAEHALTAALRLASAIGADLRIVHAIEHPTLYASAPEMDPRVVQAREDAAQEILRRARGRASVHEVPSSTVARAGSADLGLLEEAEEWGADLVAVGTRGQGGLERAILGSVADRLVRQAPVPVLSVREPVEPDVEDPIERILVPSDGSPAALSAAPLALELAERAGASLDLLFAISPELEGGNYLDRPASEVEDAHREMASQALDPLAERCRDAGVPFERVVARGPPHREIVDNADRLGADLAVMATHGRGGIERLLVGSVADKVLRTARTPLVTVQPSE